MSDQLAKNNEHWEGNLYTGQDYMRISLDVRHQHGRFWRLLGGQNGSKVGEAFLQLVYALVVFAKKPALCRGGGIAGFTRYIHLNSKVDKSRM